jgi:hypothetical protein
MAAVAGVDQALRDVLPEDWRSAPIQTTGPGAIQTALRAQYVQFGFRTKQEVLETVRNPRIGTRCVHCPCDLSTGHVFPVIADFLNYDGLYLVRDYACSPRCAESHMADYDFSPHQRMWTRQFLMEWIGVRPEEFVAGPPRTAYDVYAGGVLLAPNSMEDLPAKVMVQDAPLAPLSWIMEIHKQESKPVPVFDGLGGKTTDLHRPAVRRDPIARPEPSGKPPMILNLFVRKMEELVASGRARSAPRAVAQPPAPDPVPAEDTPPKPPPRRAASAPKKDAVATASAPKRPKASEPKVGSLAAFLL